MSNEAIQYAIVGQSKATVRSRLGMPSGTIKTPDGGEKLIYEFYSKGAPTNLNRSKVTVDVSGDMVNQEPHLNWQYSSIDTRTNAKKYTSYQMDKSVLEVFFNPEGECVGFYQNMTKNQLEQIYEGFKKYIPEK